MLQHTGNKPLLLTQQCERQMLGINFLMPELRGQPLSGAQSLARFFRESVDIHKITSLPDVRGNVGEARLVPIIPGGNASSSQFLQ